MLQKIADAGLLIAGLDRSDHHHDWARSVFELEAPPWLVCEPVLHEVSINIRTPEPLLEMLRIGDLEIAFQLDENVAEVFALIKKYRDQEMDLADACVVRMSELFEDSRVYTVDRTDFSVYRRYSRRPIPCIFPE
jgi:predicted nucleic acid-binding protein